MKLVSGAAIDCSREPVAAALLLARAFVGGHRLAVWAPGAADHAHHVAVEFVHPAITGARPLPAIAMTDAARISSTDLLLAIGDPPEAVATAITISSEQADVSIIRTYHLLWELVQVALEHPGLVGANGLDGGDTTGFLYPFLDASEDDERALRDSLTASAAAKVADSEQLAAATMDTNADALVTAAAAIAAAVGQGRRVHTMGNGGSATDATRLARLLQGAGVPAFSLSEDYAVVTALANDVGMGRVFARQVEAMAGVGDVLIGCSTSGTSPNLLAAFTKADSRGLATVGISGYGGASFAAEPGIHHRLAVSSSSVHRIQEAQAALISALCAEVSRHPGGEAR